MTFNYKTGLFRVWLVLSLLWLVVAMFAGANAGVILIVPLVVGGVLYLIVWAIRGFAVKEHPPAHTFDLQELREQLAAETDPELLKREVDPLLNRLQAEYGNHVPLSELAGLQNLTKTKLGQIEKQRQEIIDQGPAGRQND